MRGSGCVVGPVGWFEALELFFFFFGGGKSHGLIFFGEGRGMTYWFCWEQVFFFKMKRRRKTKKWAIIKK